MPRALTGLPAGLIAVALLTAAVTWLLTGGARRLSRRSRHGLDAEAALRRHPAGSGRQPRPVEFAVLDHRAIPPQQRRVTGPDDDEDFIQALERLIRGDEQGGRYLTP